MMTRASLVRLCSCSLDGCIIEILSLKNIANLTKLGSLLFSPTSYYFRVLLREISLILFSGADTITKR